MVGYVRCDDRIGLGRYALQTGGAAKWKGLARSGGVPLCISPHCAQIHQRVFGFPYLRIYFTGG